MNLTGSVLSLSYSTNQSIYMVAWISGSTQISNTHRNKKRGQYLEINSAGASCFPPLTCPVARYVISSNTSSAGITTSQRDGTDGLSYIVGEGDLSPDGTLPR